jgi:hypothetical protein
MHSQKFDDDIRIEIDSGLRHSEYLDRRVELEQRSEMERVEDEQEMHW